MTASEGRGILKREKTERKNTLKSWFPISYEEYPPAVRAKLLSLFLAFISGGTVFLILLGVLGMLEYWYFAAFIILFGVGMILQLSYFAANDRLTEVEGVVIEKERDGYRKQHLYLLIQTVKGDVYRIYAADKSRKYKEGDIVRFYSAADQLNNWRDGICEARVVYAMERVTAKITTDEEDEKLKKLKMREDENL